jgi:hypothetical protein
VPAEISGIQRSFRRRIIVLSHYDSAKYVPSQRTHYVNEKIGVSRSRHGSRIMCLAFITQNQGCTDDAIERHRSAALLQQLQPGDITVHRAFSASAIGAG